MRARIKFAKIESMRFTSHLDLHRTLERTFRRAQLPMKYSQGFNPRPKINLAAALPLGCTSQAEQVDVWLTEALAVEVIKARLLEVQPPGIEVRSVQSIPTDAPKLQRAIQSVEYIVELNDPIDDLENEVDRVLSAEHIKRERRGKVYDLRPLINSLEIIQTDSGQKLLRVHLAAREGATGRPDEVLNELGIPVESARIERTGLFFKTTEENDS